MEMVYLQFGSQVKRQSVSQAAIIAMIVKKKIKNKPVNIVNAQNKQMTKMKWANIIRNQLPQQVILICCDGQIIEFVKSERYFKITDCVCWIRIHHLH